MKHIAINDMMFTVLKIGKVMLTDQERELRRTGIGGSDIGPLMGLSKFKSPLGVYLDKVGLSTQSKPSKAMDFGNYLEDSIIKIYSQEMDCVVRVGLGTKRHPTYSYMLANVDGITDNNVIVEAKNVGYKLGWGEGGIPEVPAPYLMQVAHYCYIYNESEKAHIAAYFGGCDFRVYDYERNSRLENHIQTVCDRFWHDHVVPQNPPADKGTVKDLSVLWENLGNETSVVADDNIARLCSQLAELKARQKENEEKEEEIKKQIILSMKDNAYLVDQDGVKLVSCKSVERSSLDIDAFKKENEELYRKFIKKSVSRTFRLYGDK